MEILLPRRTRRRIPARSQSLPARLDPAFPGDWREAVKELNKGQQAETNPRPSAEETTFVRQATREYTRPQARWFDDWSYLKPDERGAELAREARVWKVYVGETDTWDGELIEGWEKSMDALLGCVILGDFNCDPNDVSAEALLAISRTLVAIATGNSSVNLVTILEQGPNNVTTFVPSPTAVIVNTLWYMSFSLSIATAFLAMLAKDWCYSFSAHRTGHPQDQAYRRQRKWKMIQRWKMEELIVVLPSLMHLSLLLFSVGLCLHLRNLNQTTAIPVMCIAGLVLAFYIWSSITASVVEFFPYTTIISRILRSNCTRAFYQAMGPFGSFVCFILHSMKTGMMYLSAALVLIPALIPALLFGPFLILDRFSFQWFAKPGVKLSKLCGLCFWGPARPLIMVYNYCDFFYSIIWSFVIRSIDNLKLPDDYTASLALGWLIEYCETPSAVDIALQAISGASQGIPKEPLLSNQATEQILRRIVSNSANDIEESTHSRYTRGLEFLGLISGPNSASSEHRFREDTQVMMWDLKSKNESRIADLIKRGNFIPSNNNLEAMRIGNSATSESLRFFMGEAKSNTDTLRSITELLTHHFESKESQLHPAAVQSLANAAALYVTLSSTPDLPPDLVRVCMRYCKQYINGLRGPGSPQPVCNIETTIMFVMCVLLHGNPGRDTSTDTAKSLAQFNIRAWHTIHTLRNVYVRNHGFRTEVCWIACSEILSNLSKYGLDEASDDWESLKNWCSEHTGRFMRHQGAPVIPWWRGSGGRMTAKAARNRILRAVSQVYAIITASSRPYSTPMHLPDSTHTTLTVIACSSLLDPWQSQICYEVLARFSFPKLSEELFTALMMLIEVDEETVLSAIGTVYINKAHPPSQRQFAAAQLWLLFDLTGDSSSHDQRTLREAIQEELGETLQLRDKGFDQVKVDLEAFIVEAYRRGRRINSREGNSQNQPSSIWSRVKSDLSARWKGSRTQQMPPSFGSGLHQFTLAVQTNLKGPPQGRHQRAYMARVVEYILATRGLEGSEDLIPLLAEDLESVAPGLRRLLPELVPLPPSRTTSPISTRTGASPTPYSAAAGHVLIEIPGVFGNPSLWDHESDLGLGSLFDGRSDLA